MPKLVRGEIQPVPARRRAPSFAGSVFRQRALGSAGLLTVDGGAVAARAHLCWNVKLAMEFAARARPGKLPSSLTADNSSQS